LGSTSNQLIGVSNEVLVLEKSSSFIINTNWLEFIDPLLYKGNLL